MELDDDDDGGIIINITRHDFHHGKGGGDFDDSLCGLLR